MSEDRMRVEFEAWAKRTLGGDHRTNDMGEYINEDWEYPWWAWQAARAAMVVELPKQAGLDKPFIGMPMDEMKADNSYNLALSRCRAAIEAAGVKVKP